ncbi:glycoside hydrolase family 2 protein [Chthonobacter albigriseus]|uniref:glycoside hydrolase family 2 protein n=1 Tax=Chthonobacter albigriseus TaxID=1683161 RepID=UPI0015EE3BDF|nr:glycoside hydrolase family 2 protein [Chthonobacter albigriseus]
MRPILWQNWMMGMETGAGAVRLNEDWVLHVADSRLPLEFPADIHSVLLAAGEIPDPYWRDTEPSLDWVHQRDWVVSRSFDVAAALDGTWTLTVPTIDCFATVRLNGVVVGRTESQFVRYDLDVTGALREGRNDLEITFHSATAVAAEKRDAFPFALPYLTGNCRIGHVNFLRKTACHAGWDWNIALMPLGIYGDVLLRRSALARLDELKVVQHHEAGSVTVEVTAYLHGNGVGETAVVMDLDGQVVERTLSVVPGENRLVASFVIDEPRLWWPAGHGEQPLYDLTVHCDGQALTRRIGLRTVRLITEPDEVGARFAFAVNGREIVMRGANWIPADALPARCTPDVVRDRLQSARDVHMNMIRIWGGGQYEPDWFYDLCSEMGIMVWHDFMFACNHYPGADNRWLKLVRLEARQQIRRLSSQPSMALWCGDNELVGALRWFPETRADRDRYLANYDRLNHALEECFEDEAPDVPFWPSSPSIGRLNFGDGWHDDRSGDMHFWDVWHSAKDFEHYRTVQPRFCSEFGFQSFPSMPVIESFTEPGDRNVSSRVMEIHQRNDGGNSRIVETLVRYFPFPDRFEDMVWLSQISQALAMKTAIEWWRSRKPRNMGVLYWQLNDTWPVASWASLEYGGGWKATHYLARHFMAPVLLTAQPGPGETVGVHAVNDGNEATRIVYRLSRQAFGGERTLLTESTCEIPPDRAVEIASLPAGRLGEADFLHIEWTDLATGLDGENTFFPNRFKAYDIGVPDVSIRREGDDLILVSDRVALFVTVDLGRADVLTDNCFHLYPGRPKRIGIYRRRGSELRTGLPEPELTFLRSGPPR